MNRHATPKVEADQNENGASLGNTATWPKLVVERAKRNRTLDIQLGKLTFYLLNYARICNSISCLD